MNSARFDLVVLGAGPGGYDAAVKAAGYGLRVALVERDLIGGTCLNRGCIPTKLFLGATSPVEELAAQSRVRVASGSVSVDLPALQKRKALLLKSTRQAMAANLHKLGVVVVAGTGRLTSAREMAVETPEGTRTLGFDKLVLATGSRPTSFPGLAADHDAILDSTSLLDLAEVPDSLVIVGAGYIGLEMAQIFSRLGSRITLIEGMDRIDPMEDPEVSQALAKHFGRHWDIRVSAKVTSLKTEDGKAKLVLESGEEIVAAKALVSVGRRPNSEGIGLELAGVELDKRGFVRIDGHLRAADGIYVVGDLNGLVQLAHAASHQAGHAADHLAGRTTAPYAPGPVPSCLYGSPETMRVGGLASELAGRPGVAVSRAGLMANPIAQAHGANMGFVKCVWQDGRLAGVTACGFGVSGLTVQATIMVAEGWTRERVETLVFPHPSLDEALKDGLLAPLEPLAP
jgi:dihydrolipoamide dehydrogenase